jgi:hypothetical protein
MPDQRTRLVVILIHEASQGGEGAAGSMRSGCRGGGQQGHVSWLAWECMVCVCACVSGDVCGMQRNASAVKTGRRCNKDCCCGATGAEMRRAMFAVAPPMSRACHARAAALWGVLAPAAAAGLRRRQGSGAGTTCRVQGAAWPQAAFSEHTPTGAVLSCALPNRSATQCIFKCSNGAGRWRRGAA